MGDGAFESCAIYDGEVFALTRHLARLARSASGLGLSPPDEQRIRDGIAAVLEADPEARRAREEAARTERGVWSYAGEDGLRTIVAKAASGDVRWFMAAVDRLAEVLRRDYGRAVHLNIIVDGSILGGARIEIGDEVVDGTVLSRLENARRRMAG